MTALLIVHLLIAIALVTVVLMQRSEGGALGIGGGGGGGGFMTGRGTANLLTRITAGLALAFFCTSMTLAILAGRGGETRSILDTQPASGESAPAAPTSGGVLDDLKSGRGLAPLPDIPQDR